MATQLITLEGDSEYYTVGVPIKGTVNIMMPKAKTVTGVYVRLNGNVYTHWVKEGIKCYYNENFIE